MVLAPGLEGMGLAPMHALGVHEDGPWRCEAKGVTRLDLLFCFVLVWVFFWSFLGPHPQHMEVPRPGVQSEL